MTYASLLLAYLAGSVPTSFIVGKVFHKIDLREHGSGNLGATNAFRVLGARSAFPVFVLDIAKGFLPVSVLPGLVEGGFGWTLALAASAILGHMYSVWVGFRGGKGIATSAGVFLALAPWALLGGVVTWCAVSFSTGYVSVGSISAAAIFPLLIALTPHQGEGSLVWFSIASSGVVIWAHRTNIRRLMRGEEHRFRKGEAATAVERPESGDNA